MNECELWSIVTLVLKRHYVEIDICVIWCPSTASKYNITGIGTKSRSVTNLSDAYVLICKC